MKWNYKSLEKKIFLRGEEKCNVHMCVLATKKSLPFRSQTVWGLLLLLLWETLLFHPNEGEVSLRPALLYFILFHWAQQVAPDRPDLLAPGFNGNKGPVVQYVHKMPFVWIRFGICRKHSCYILSSSSLPRLYGFSSIATGLNYTQKIFSTREGAVVWYKNLR